MATTSKIASNGKEKSRSYTSTPQRIDLSNGRKTPKTSVILAFKELSLLTGKLPPHYLKSTISSANEVCKCGKKQTFDDSSLKQFLKRRASFENSSPSQLQRTPSSAGPRGRTHKPSCPSPKRSSSLKPISERTLNTPRIVKTQPVCTKPVSIKRRLSTTTKKETIGNTSLRTTRTPSLNVTKTRGIKAALDNKVILVQQVEQETIKVVDKEEIQLQLRPFLGETPIDPMNFETENPKDKRIDDSNSLILSEEQELEPATHREEAGNGNHDDNEVQGDNNNNNSNNYEDCSKHPKPEMEAEKGEESMIKNTRIHKGNAASTKDLSDKTTPYKLKFQKGKEMIEIEDENEGMQRLEFKKREGDLDGVDDGKAEQENIVLKRQDVQAKKDSPKYNDMIEETANKLVEKKKSKVKALVGAFETVFITREQGSTSLG